MTVAERIKKLREEREWTQEQLAEKMGYAGKSTVCKMENAGDNISTKKIKKVAEIFGVKPSYLMGWDDVSWNPDSQTIIGENDEYSFSPEDTEKERLIRFLYENPEYQVLFDASTKVKPEDIKKALKVIGLFIDE